MSEFDSEQDKRVENKTIFSNYIKSAVQNDEKEGENISETKVIENFCEAYNLSYSTFIRWYIRDEKINAKSEAQINKALAENFGRCFCYKVQHIDRQIFEILSDPVNRIIIEAEWSTDRDLEELQKVFKNQISVIEEIEKAVSVSRKINRNSHAKNQLEMHKGLTSLCLDIKKKFDQHKFNLYAAKVPYFRVENDSPDFKDYRVFLLVISEVAGDRLSYTADLSKIQ